MSVREPDSGPSSETPGTNTVPDLLVEQLALGELDEASAASVRERLAVRAQQGGEGEADALARIAASNAEILADYPPERALADIRRRAEREAEAQAQNQLGARSRRGLAWLAAPVLVAAAALVWVVVDDDPGPGPDTLAVVDPPLTGDGDGDVTRIKGGVEPHVVIDRRTGAGHERLGSGDIVSAGDLLQVSYVPAGRHHGVIVSLDGAGAVTLHYPSEREASPKLAEGQEVPLGHSYELDDAPGFERFMFVTREGPAPSVTEVLEAAESLARDPVRARLGPLTLAGEGWEQHSIILRKAPSSAEGAPDEPVPAATGAEPEPEPEPEPGPEPGEAP